MFVIDTTNQWGVSLSNDGGKNVFGLKKQNIEEVVRVLQDYLDNQPHEEGEEHKKEHQTLKDRLYNIERRLDVIGGGY